MSSLAKVLVRATVAWVPAPYRSAFEGDLLEQVTHDLRSRTQFEAHLSLVLEIARSAPSLLRWRLQGGPTMESPATRALDPFRLDTLTPKATIGHALRLFRSFYLRALGVFLLVHFPLRVVGHFVRSDSAIGEMVGSTLAQALLANGVLLVSWTLVEGALLATLVARRRGEQIGIGASLAESVRRFPTFLAARTIFLAAVVLGTALLVVPGVLAACLLMLHGWMIFDRRLGVFASLAESVKVVRSRLRSTVGISLPVAGITALWVVAGVAMVAVTLRLTAPIMPIFKIAPFTMTLMETGFLLFTLLTGIVYANYTARGRQEGAAA